MQAVNPYNMIEHGFPVPSGVTGVGWTGESWTGPEKRTHNVETLLWSVESSLSKTELVQIIRKARADHPNVELMIFENGDCGSVAIWDSSARIKIDLAASWDVPREMVQGL